MKKSLSILSKYFLPACGDWTYWIVVAIAFKSVIFLLQLPHEHVHAMAGFLGGTGGDTESYLAPIENFIRNGEYAPDYRMPGYALLYFPLAMIFPKVAACNILIILQVLLASVSVYCLALTARNCFHSNTLFYVVFYTFSISCFASLFDSFLLTESLCTSTTIFSAYFFSLFLRQRRSAYLLYSGAFLTWTIYLRPVYAPLLLFFCVVMLYDGLTKKRLKKELLKNVLIFLLPFALVESVWVIRNYTVHKKIIVLTSSLYYPEIEGSYILELMDFVKAFGGDRTWWNPDAEIRWFGLVESQAGRSRPLENKNIQLPTYIFNSRFNLDSLESIKIYIQKINDIHTPSPLVAEYTRLVKGKLILYTQSIREEEPFLYYVEAPGLLLKKFFVHSGTYNLFSKTYAELSPLEKLLKIFYSLLYVATVSFSMAAIFLVLLRKKTDPLPLFILGITLYSVILFPVILRQIEFRYLVPVYPFMTLLACYFVLRSEQFVRTKFLPTKS